MAFCLLHLDTHTFSIFYMLHVKYAVSCGLTISRFLWHVRHFVIMHMTTYMCNNSGAHKPWWVYRFFCYTNLCFKVNGKCYFDFMLNIALCSYVKCDTCFSYGNKRDLIWFHNNTCVIFRSMELERPIFVQYHTNINNITNVTFCDNALHC